MITSQNNNYNVKYAALFNEALEVLKEEGKISQDASNFTSLEEYFMHIGDLANIHGSWVESTLNGGNASGWNERFAKYSKFLMLPLDEDYFKIDANTRTISVPALFANHGVSLVGDSRAETLIFEIDRYFDFIDLLRTNIYVQWTNPAKTDGATLITLIDYDDKKIRFGWTLSDQITVSGSEPLKFSIRMFMRNDAGAITYSLNTLPVSVKIRPVLRIAIENTYTDENPWLFTNAIVNGADSNVSTFPEQAIIYKNLASQANLSVDDSLVFEIGAYAPDTGILSYSWKFIPYTNQDIVETLTGTDGDITTRVVMVETADTAINPNKKYYVSDGDGGFTLCVFEDNAVFDPEETYFEESAQCIIGASTTNFTVAGQYYVNIINTVGGNTTIKKSAVCTVPHPEKIDYNTDLVESGENNILAYTVTKTEDTELDAEKTYYTKAANGEYVEFTGEAFEENVEYYEFSAEKEKELKIIAISTPTHAAQTYKWYKVAEEDGEEEEIVEAQNLTTCTVTEPGWYYAVTTSTLNRVVIEKESKISKITNTPTAPIIAEATGDVQSINFNTIGSSTYAIIITASVANDDELDPALISDELIYEWVHQVKDAVDGTPQYEPVAVGAYGVKSINGNTLTIEYGGDSEVFKCNVYNKLNGVTAKTESDPYLATKA